jgi:hypothetical protein
MKRCPICYKMVEEKCTDFCEKLIVQQKKEHETELDKCINEQFNRK